MEGLISTAIPLLLVAVPAVEFVDIADRLPQLHPGLFASGILVAILALAVWGVSRSGGLR